MRALLLTLALVTTGVWAGEVYRSVGPDGTVIYSDVPTGPNAQAIYIAVPGGSSQLVRPTQPAAPSTANSPGAGTDAAKPGGADAGKPAAPSAADLAKDKAKNCKIARDRVQRYSVAHRLYRNLPNGEREYLSDAEIDEAKARAAADVERWCN